MYKILDPEVMLRIDNKWHSTTAVLVNVSGGLQVNFVDADGNILKSQAYSRSSYSRKNGDGFDENEETPSLANLLKPAPNAHELDKFFGHKPFVDTNNNAASIQP